MARIGISITKTVSFRGIQQEFSNVYYYDGLGGVPTNAQAASLIDELVAKEKVFHAIDVQFLRGRLWTDTGNKATNEMIDQHALSGVGLRTANTSMDRERAFLFKLRAGVDSRGNPVFLRKWYHACGEFVGNQAIPANVLQQTAQWTQAQRDAQVAAMNTIGTCGAAGTLGTLCAKGGRLTTPGALWQAHPYLEHHQLGDMWRAQ